MLSYGSAALKLTTCQLADMNTCWNTMYRRAFDFRKYDSLRMFIAGIGRLDFSHLRLFSVLRFIKKAMSLGNRTLCFVSKNFTLSEEFLGYCGKC